MALVFVVYSIAKPKNRKVVKKSKTGNGKQLSLIQFAKKYRKFMILAIGCIAVSFTHTLVNNFFIQIIKPIGGTESQMGIAVFIAAMLELPAMSAFDKVREKVGCTILVKFSVIMFIVKHVITYFAPNMFFIYIAQVTQMFAYAIYTPALVYYVTKVVAIQDINKGQSTITMAIVASGIIANLIGGVLLDVISVSAVLLVGVASSIIGAGITFISLDEIK